MKIEQCKLVFASKFTQTGFAVLLWMSKAFPANFTWPQVGCRCHHVGRFPKVRVSQTWLLRCTRQYSCAPGNVVHFRKTNIASLSAVIIIKGFDRFKSIKHGKYYKIFFCLLIFVFFLVIVELSYFKNRAPLGASIGEHYVGGKTYREIETLLQEMKNNLEKEEINLNLSFENITLTYPLVEMGITIEQERIIEEIHNLYHPFNYIKRFQTYRNGETIPGLFTVKKECFENVLSAIKKERCYPPEDAEVWAEEGILKYRLHKNGKGLKENKLYSEILQRLYHWPSFPLSIQLEAENLPPAKKISDIMNMGIKDKIVSFSTFFDHSSQDRNHNISLAVKMLDNVLLVPGDVFSFNQIVGEASLEKGYREAPIIVNEQIAMGPGGGICQVSSTIYNAALLSGLEVEERHNHGLPVNYLPPGFDAAIAYDYLDLKFKNNLPFHILIHMQVLDNELRVNFFGDPSRCPEVELITQNLNSIPPPVHYREITDKPPSYREIIQEGRAGYTVETIRIFWKDGAEVSRENLGKNYYAPRPEICAVGVLSEE